MRLEPWTWADGESFEGRSYIGRWGGGRRLELRGPTNGASVYSDFMKRDVIEKGWLMVCVWIEDVEGGGSCAVIRVCCVLDSVWGCVVFVFVSMGVKVLSRVKLFRSEIKENRRCLDLVYGS